MKNSVKKTAENHLEKNLDEQVASRYDAVVSRLMRYRADGKTMKTVQTETMKGENENEEGTLLTGGGTDADGCYVLWLRGECGSADAD